METFLGFADECHVAHKVFITQWIVYVGDGDMVVFQRFAKQNILITIVLESFIQRESLDDASLDEEIGGMEISVWMGLAQLMVAVLRATTFEDVAQVVLHQFWVGLDLVSAIYHVVLLGMLISGEILGMDDAHVAVDEEQPGMQGMLCQKVTDGSPSYVFLSFDETAVGQLAYVAVFGDGESVG